MSKAPIFKIVLELTLVLVVEFRSPGVIVEDRSQGRLMEWAETVSCEICEQETVGVCEPSGTSTETISRVRISSEETKIQLIQGRFLRKIQFHPLCHP